ncbi:MAG: helix-turn-helix domain-containing protein, partial [Duncaniella sp.]|nr:helix-turn-helix domain-containing protein [Duncaniella sp.]
IYTVREDACGDVWMGTKGEGLYRLTPVGADGKSFKIKRYSCLMPDSSLPSDTIYDVVTHRGDVWLGSYGGGLSRGVRDADGNYKFSYVPGQPQGMKVRGLMIDEPSETLMVATTDGLVTVDISATEPRFYVNRFRPEPWGLKGNDVMEIIRTDDRYYVCVFGVGVSRIVSDNLLNDSIHFETYPLPMGAAATQIRTAVPSGNDIWIMSERTVSRFSTETGIYATRFIGAPTDRYSLSEADPVVLDGYITAGTSDGVVTFRPSDLIAEGVTAPVPIVTGVQYQNEPAIHPLNDLTTLKITPEQRTFTLFLSPMTFDTSDHEGERPQFRYMLDDYDKGWNYTSAVSPSVNYSNISPGRYTLRIETLNPDGSWSDARQIEVKVEARFTETLLFRFMIVFVVLALLFGMAVAVFRFKRMRNEIQQKYSLLMSVDNISSSLTPDRLAARQAETSEDKDRKFLDESAAFIAANIDNPDLVVEDLARNSGMSRTAYYTRLKQITGLTPVDFIKQMRIKKALELLEGGKLSVTEVAYGVGFTDPKYFSRCFKAEMDMTPTQYIESRRNNAGGDTSEAHADS